MKRGEKKKVLYYEWQCVDCFISMQTRLKKKSDQFEQEHKGHHAYMRRGTGPMRLDGYKEVA